MTKKNFLCDDDVVVDPETGENYYRVSMCCWISESEKNLVDARRKAASALVEYIRLQNNKKRPGPCACMGLSCKALHCGVWWDMFFQKYYDEFLESTKELVDK